MVSLPPGCRHTDFCLSLSLALCLVRIAFCEHQRPVSGHAADDSTYVKVRLEGDRTVPYYICAEGASKDSAEFSKKPVIFVVIHSDAVASIKVRDKKDGAHFYGQARISPWSIPKCLCRRCI